MADEAQSAFRNLNWREIFPFTNLFRAFRIAVHPSKLILALAALLLIYVGGRILDGIWPARSSGVPFVREGGDRDIAGAAAAGRMTEVEAYERYATLDDSGARSFTDARWKMREALEADYARALVNTKIVATDEEGRKAAAGADHLGKVREKINEDRDKDLAQAKKDYEEAKKAALDAYDKEGKNASGDAKERAEKARDDAVEAAEDTYKEREASIRARANEEYEQAALIKGEGLFEIFLDYEVKRVNGVVNGVLSNNWLDPGGVVDQIWRFLAVGPGWLVSQHPIYFVLFAIWFLLIWAVFGGAICRIAAVHVARDEKISVRQALRFSVNKLLSFAFAPLIPLVIIVVIAVVVAVVGWILFSIPWIGPIIAGLTFVLALLAGFIMALVLIGTIGGFNLMYPTIAVEGSDSFDAISRSFSYVFARPWRMLFYTIVALIYGALTFLFVRFFIWLVLALTHWSVSWFMASDSGAARRFYPLWPRPELFDLPHDVPSALGGGLSIAAFLIAFWVYLVIGLLGAYAISYYFTSNTIIYFLMRREVDATELDDVYVEESEDEFGETAPVAGTTTTSTTTTTTTATTPTGDTGTSGSLAAPSTGTTSAPGGGASGSGGSADAGGGAVRSYTSPQTDTGTGGTGGTSTGSGGDTGTGSSGDRPAT